MTTLFIIFAIIILILIFQNVMYNEKDSEQWKRKKLFLDAGILNPHNYSLNEIQKKKYQYFVEIRDKLSNKSATGIYIGKTLKASGFIITELPSDNNLQVIKAKIYSNKENAGFLYYYSFISKETKCYKILNKRVMPNAEYSFKGTNTITIDLISIWEGIFANEELKKMNNEIIEFYNELSH
jgi:hypothetical protein